MKRIVLLITIFTFACASNMYCQDANILLNLENEIVSTGSASIEQAAKLFALNSKNNTAVSIAWSILKTNIVSLSEQQLKWVHQACFINDSLHNKGEYLRHARAGISQRIMSGTLYTNFFQDHWILDLYNNEYREQNPEVFQKAYTLSMQPAVTNVQTYTTILRFAISSGQSEDITILWALEALKASIRMVELNYAFEILNNIVYLKSIKVARASGKKTVGVVVPEYKNIIDSQRDGAGFVEALKAFGWDWPGNWSNEVAQVDQVVSDIYSGEIIKPTEEQLVKIRLYKGSDFLRDFVEKFNKL